MNNTLNVISWVLGVALLALTITTCILSLRGLPVPIDIGRLTNDIAIGFLGALTVSGQKKPAE